jgi:hypothetical protein
MRSELFTAAGVVLGIALACNGGQLDAFSQREPIVSGGGDTANGGTANGGTANGGRGGSSGNTSPGGEGGEGPVDYLPIDDFEDGNQVALLNDGAWFVSNDGTGVQTLAVEMSSVEKPGSTFSLHTSGLGFARLGSIICDIAGTAASFDASHYAALTFSARAEAGSNPDVLFSFLVGSVHFAVPVRLATDWQVHTIRFSDTLPAEDPNAIFDPRAIAAIQFVVPNNATFDFRLDDLAFVK